MAKVKWKSRLQKRQVLSMTEVKFFELLDKANKNELGELTRHMEFIKKRATGTSEVDVNVPLVQGTQWQVHCLIGHVNSKLFWNGHLR